MPACLTYRCGGSVGLVRDRCGGPDAPTSRFIPAKPGHLSRATVGPATGPVKTVAVFPGRLRPL